MSFKSLSLGLVVGAVSGAAISLFNAPKSGNELQQSFKDTSGDLKTQFDHLKQEATEVKDAFLQTKNDSQEVFSTLGDEVKSMIANYKADIQPNIDKMNNHTENLSNRAERLSNVSWKSK